jgi:hypothetical protein
MTANCLDKNAQFRYLDSQLLHNIGKNGTLISSTIGHYERLCAVYKGVSSQGRDNQKQLHNRLKQTSGDLCFFSQRDDGYPVCAAPSSKNHYLNRVKCDKSEDQKFTFGK